MMPLGRVLWVYSRIWSPSSRELEGGSPLHEFDKKSRNIFPKFGILIENLPNDSCILTGDFDRFFKRSDRPPSAPREVMNPQRITVES